VAARLHPLKKYRKKHGISAAGMAKLVKMTRASIERIERYEQAPPIPTIEKLVAATGLLVTDFFPPKGRAKS
jgi:transcriptional regulator with XRE-family HTH domain